MYEFWDLGLAFWVEWNGRCFGGYGYAGYIGILVEYRPELKC
jgi:hypothetical protein